MTGRTAVVLDRTAFYPTSGGQPFDTGTLGGVRVDDVVDLEDGRIAHVVAAPLAPGAEVHGEVDWPRRFDHMQQHTGQHVLSAAFDRVHRRAHRELPSRVRRPRTIDLAVALSAEAVAAAEQEANRDRLGGPARPRPVRVGGRSGVASAAQGAGARRDLAAGRSGRGSISPPAAARTSPAPAQSASSR